MQVVGACIAGRYRLECLLGEGGMGSVWRALHLELDAAVAVKFQHAQKARGARAAARFRREARAAAKLTNPHVVRIVDFGVDAETPYLVMELLEGESLKARLERQTHASLAVTTELVRQAASALDAVHGAGVVHRDLKPSNLFLTRGREGEVLKLLDFGIAKWFDHGEGGAAVTTESGLVVGSVQYMSPEQARGEGVDPRTDVWALGVVSYQLITGRLPFEGTNVPDTLRRVCVGRFDPPSAGLGAEYAALDPVFERAFAVNRDERFASAGKLATAFVEATAAVPEARRAPKSLPAAGGWAFGREGSTETASPSGVAPRARRAGNAPLVAGLGALVLMLTVTWFFSSVSSDVSGAAVLRGASVAKQPEPRPTASSPSAPRPQSQAAAPAVARPSSSVVGITAMRPATPRKRVRSVVPSSSATERTESTPAPARPQIDPVFGLEVPGSR